MDELLSNRQGGVLWLQLNRPAAMNALTPSLVDSLARAIEDTGASRVVVLHGAGRAFCAGTDLKQSEQRAAVPGANEAYIDSLHRLTDAIERCPRPVIAAVNGATVAGGLELALACDLIVAAASARLGDGHASYAMFPGGGATVRLPRRIGAPATRRLMFTGDLLPAAQALAIGLVDEVLPDAELQAGVQALAQRMADRSPVLLARMKQAVREASLDRERQLYAEHAVSFDRAEGLAAFREKRVPQYQGR